MSLNDHNKVRALNSARQTAIVNPSGRKVIADNQGTEALHANPLAGTPQATKTVDWLSGLLGGADAVSGILGDEKARQYNDALTRAKAGDYSVKGGWFGLTSTQQKAQDHVKGELAGQQSFGLLHEKSKEIKQQLEQDFSERNNAWKVNEHNVRLEKAIHSLVSSKKSPEYVGAFLSKARPYGNKLVYENLQAHIASDKKTYIDNTSAIIRKSLTQVSPNLSDSERTQKVQANLKELQKRIKEGGYTEYDYKAAEQRLVLEHAQHTEGGADLLRDMQGKEGGTWISAGHIEQAERLELGRIEITERRRKVQQNVNYSAIQENIVKAEMDLEDCSDITDPQKRSEALMQMTSENNKRLLALRGAESGTYSAEQYTYLNKRSQAIKDIIAGGGEMPQIPQEALSRARELQFDSTPEATEELKGFFLKHAGRQLPKDLVQSRSYCLNRTEQERKGRSQAQWGGLRSKLLNNIHYNVDQLGMVSVEQQIRKQRQEAINHYSEISANMIAQGGGQLTPEIEKEITDKFHAKFTPKTEDQRTKAEAYADAGGAVSKSPFEIKDLTPELADTIRGANPRELQELRTKYLKQNDSQQGWKVLCLKAGRVPNNLSEENTKEIQALQQGHYYSSTQQLLASPHTYATAQKTYGIDTLNPHMPIEQQMVFVEDSEGQRSLIKLSEKGQEDKVMTSAFSPDTKVLVWEKRKTHKLLGLIPVTSEKAGYKLKLMKDVKTEELELLNSVKPSTFPFDINKPRYNQNSLDRVQLDTVPYSKPPVQVRSIDPQILTLNLSSASVPLEDHYVILGVTQTMPNHLFTGWTVRKLKDVSEEQRGSIISRPIDPNLEMLHEVDRGVGSKEVTVDKLINILKGQGSRTLLSAKPIKYMTDRELHKVINPEHFK